MRFDGDHCKYLAQISCIFENQQKSGHGSQKLCCSFSGSRGRFTCSYLLEDFEKIDRAKYKQIEMPVSQK
jgi:hypothetical protein